MKLTYVNNFDEYAQDVHECWMYLLHHLDGLEITAMAGKEGAVEFIPTNPVAEKLVRFLSDCDIGLVMTERQRREYEEENGPLFPASL